MLKEITFFTLLVANLMLFAWGYQRQLPQPVMPALPTLEDGPTIVLSSEAPPSSFAPVMTQKLAQHCARVGPIDKQLMATEIAAILNQAGHETTLETENTIKNSGFWLVIATTDEQSATLMAELSSAGVSDVWRFDKGPLAGMLSLGIYSDHTKAEKRLNFLNTKGFNAEIKPREVEIPSYWIHTRYITTDQAALRSMEQIYERYPGLTFPPPNCSS